MIILNEIYFPTHCIIKCLLIKAFHKEPAVITKYLRFEN